MCNTCKVEDTKVAILREAKTNRSLITNELLDWLIKYIEDTQDARLDYLWENDR